MYMSLPSSVRWKSGTVKASQPAGSDDCDQLLQLA